MLAHLETNLGRQVEHLPALGPHQLRAGEALTAALTALRLVLDDPVWFGDLGEMMALAAGLAARLSHARRRDRRAFGLANRS